MEEIVKLKKMTADQVKEQELKRKKDWDLVYDKLDLEKIRKRLGLDKIN